MDFTIVYASELMDRIRKSNALLVDIREKEDYEKGHWPGAVNYPYDDISRGKRPLAYIDIWRRELPDRVSIILYCEHGGGSMQMARMLGQEGYQVATVVGGYEAMKKVQENYFKNRRNV